MFRRFFGQASRVLSPEGMVLVVYSSLSGDVAGEASAAGFRAEILRTIHMFFEDIVLSAFKL